MLSNIHIAKLWFSLKPVVSPKPTWFPVTWIKRSNKSLRSPRKSFRKWNFRRFPEMCSLRIKATEKKRVFFTGEKPRVIINTYSALRNVFFIAEYALANTRWCRQFSIGERTILLTRARAHFLFALGYSDILAGYKRAKLWGGHVPVISAKRELSLDAFAIKSHAYISRCGLIFHTF